MSELVMRRGAAVVLPPHRPFDARALLAGLELATDLGDGIFSRRWWQGLATLAALLGCAALLLRGPEAVPGVVRPALMPAEATVLGALTTDPLGLGGDGRRAEVPFTRAVVRLAEPPERPRINVTARLAGGGMEGALVRGGVGRAEAQEIVRIASGAADVGKLKPGTAFEMVLGRRETKAVPRPLEQLAFRAAFDLRLEIRRAANGALALKRIPIAIDHTPLRIEGRVGRSFYDAAERAGVPEAVVDKMARLFAYRVDFERGVRGSDRFVAVLEHQRAETGETITGGLIYAKLDRGKGDPVEMLRWQAGGREQWFLPDGSSVQKGLMQTPVDGARMTSGFGLRIHPILGYSRFHKGVDFGAAAGTPILAAAAGKVSFAGWHGGHGNYVMIAHGRGLQTAYGHMSRIIAKPGQAVGQGQLIGYVGSTGLSTGPHLHFETWQNGEAVDPRGAKFVAGPQLGGGELARFRAELGRMRVAGRRPEEVAAVAEARSKA